MTVTLCKRLAAVTGLRLPETVGWDYGSISGLAQYLEAELAGGHGRLKSAGPVNSGATGLWAIEEQLNKVEELVAVIADGEAAGGRPFACPAGHHRRQRGGPGQADPGCFDS